MPNKTRLVGFAAIVGLCVAVLACSKPAQPGASGPEGTQLAPQAGKSSFGAASSAIPAPSLPMLAYTYGYLLELPGGRVREVLAGHERACAAAGAAVCQVMGSNLREADGEVTAELSLRALPAWLANFRAGIGRDAERAKGRLASSSTKTEDLTRQIVDTEAALRAKSTLRERLTRLLAERPGKLEDLLKVEQELARVQGEIDATQSELAVMRTRVETSALTINYESFHRAVSARAAEPLKAAARNVFGIVMTVLAAMLTLAAVVVPILLVGVGGWLIWRRVRGKRRRDGRQPVRSEPPSI